MSTAMQDYAGNLLNVKGACILARVRRLLGHLQEYSWSKIRISYTAGLELK